jgi:hypothetical protein
MEKSSIQIKKEQLIKDIETINDISLINVIKDMIDFARRKDEEY